MHYYKVMSLQTRVIWQEHGILTYNIHSDARRLIGKLTTDWSHLDRQRMSFTCTWRLRVDCDTSL